LFLDSRQSQISGNHQWGQSSAVDDIPVHFEFWCAKELDEGQILVINRKVGNGLTIRVRLGEWEFELRKDLDDSRHESDHRGVQCRVAFLVAHQHRSL
jgi:hypothetical protein